MVENAVEAWDESLVGVYACVHVTVMFIGSLLIVYDVSGRLSFVRSNKVFNIKMFQILIKNILNEDLKN